VGDGRNESNKTGTDPIGESAEIVRKKEYTQKIAKEGGGGAGLPSRPGKRKKAFIFPGKQLGREFHNIPRNLDKAQTHAGTN